MHIEQQLQQAPATWAERIPLLEAQFDWILFDLPQRLPAHAAAINQHARCTLPLRLACVDPVSHVFLQRQPDDTRLLLANRYDPVIPVQRDLMQLWLHAHGRGWCRSRCTRMRGCRPHWPASSHWAAMRPIRWLLPMWMAWCCGAWRRPHGARPRREDADGCPRLLPGLGTPA